MLPASPKRLPLNRLLCAYSLTHGRTRMDAKAHVRTRTQTHAHKRACAHTHTNARSARASSRIRTHAHTHAHANKQTHTHPAWARDCSQAESSSLTRVSPARRGGALLSLACQCNGDEIHARTHAHVGERARANAPTSAYTPSLPTRPHSPQTQSAPPHTNTRQRIHAFMHVHASPYRHARARARARASSRARLFCALHLHPRDALPQTRTRARAGAHARTHRHRHKAHAHAHAHMRSAPTSFSYAPSGLDTHGACSTHGGCSTREFGVSHRECATSAAHTVPTPSTALGTPHGVHAPQTCPLTLSRSSFAQIERIVLDSDFTQIPVHHHTFLSGLCECRADCICSIQFAKARSSSRDRLQIRSVFF